MKSSSLNSDACGRAGVGAGGAARGAGGRAGDARAARLAPPPRAPRAPPPPPRAARHRARLARIQGTCTQPRSLTECAFDIITVIDLGREDHLLRFSKKNMKLMD